MKKFIIKSIAYVVLILLILEGLVRILHLYDEDPPRFIDEAGVEKRIPGNEGISVTGNRIQNHARFHINKFGYNSFREFIPTDTDKEIALIGDSFIQGFHIDYTNSIGKKIEDQLPQYKVFEFGYAGYDLADQLYLIHAYDSIFKAIDDVIIYVHYPDDLYRDDYEPNQDRVNMLNSPLFKIRDEIKLLSYASAIGLVDPIKEAILSIRSSGHTEVHDEISDSEKIASYLRNIESLFTKFPPPAQKTAFLIDGEHCAPEIVSLLKSKGYPVIDYSGAFAQSEKPVTLIYDQHWNENGRKIIARCISEYINSKKSD
ncbi:hypothetical protein [Robertkochia solimangrovi]|uniref:hypothetical protein n=1 Tax=Robertkochia solimangrovi TaxID=2213046 RepID=UPI00117BE387|nr:hypothetical protein [Robertkochia solimangrovi]TRZ42530.1 hypothetical protein DMZ48_13595 [Robertkochia solimangrovi]